ncbi:hypothetical protein AYO44_05285 [Planctomycetaceae bacterium SCGC AG-212-F19]|nr:hypothetical protein AYO44_05285 [Planctomycetaceae bacterium SCGC AG-212-F19]
MSAAPLVSVVMSVYNGARYLPEAAESIQAQTFRDFEFVVVDDGSTDTTAALLDRYAQLDPRIRPLRQENQGLIRSLNRGVHASRGKYIARMDADDVALPDRLEKQVARLESQPELAVLGGAVRWLTSRGPHSGVHRNPCDPGEAAGMLRRQSCLVHPTVMMRRDVFCATGGYRQAFKDAEDYDLWLRMAATYPVANLPDTLLHYRVHDGQVSGTRIVQQAMSTLAAQMCAALRSRGRPDPAEGVDCITWHFLEELGCADDAMRAAVINAFEARVALLLTLGLVDQATGLVEGQLASPGALADCQLAFHADPAVGWLRAKIALARGQYPRAARHLWEAAVGRPRYLKRMLASLVRQLARR